MGRLAASAARPVSGSRSTSTVPAVTDLSIALSGNDAYLSWSEASGNVTLENIAEIGAAGPDFVSVGRITHSASCSDFSLRMSPLGE